MDNYFSENKVKGSISMYTYLKEITSDFKENFNRYRNKSFKLRFLRANAVIMMSDVNI